MRKKSHKQISSSTLGVLIGIAVIGVITVFRELGAMRRYLRMTRM